MLENKLSTITQNKYVITCANGTDAIQIALRAAGVRKNDLVLVPNLTFWSTFEAVVNVGASPITIDADVTDGEFVLIPYLMRSQNIHQKRR